MDTVCVSEINNNVCPVNCITINHKQKTNRTFVCSSLRLGNDGDKLFSTSHAFLRMHCFNRPKIMQ